jgi:hypothetical protein
VRVRARERAQQSRSDAIAAVLDNLSLGVREEMSLRETRKAEKAASSAEASDTGN